MNEKNNFNVLRRN